MGSYTRLSKLEKASDKLERVLIAALGRRSG